MILRLVLEEVARVLEFRADAAQLLVGHHEAAQAPNLSVDRETPARVARNLGIEQFAVERIGPIRQLLQTAQQPFIDFA